MKNKTKVWIVFSWWKDKRYDCEGVFTDQNKANEISKIIGLATTVCPCIIDKHLTTIDEDHSWPGSYFVYPDGTRGVE